MRDNRRAVGQGVKSTLELRTKDVAESALANTAGRRKKIVGEWGVARHTLPVGAARGNRTKVTEERSMGGEELSESVVSSDLLVSGCLRNPNPRGTLSLIDHFLQLETNLHTTMVQGTTKGLQAKPGSSSSNARRAHKAAANTKKGRRTAAPKKAVTIKQAAMHKASPPSFRGTPKTEIRCRHSAPR